MSDSNHKRRAIPLRQEFEEEFKNSRTQQQVPRLIFYCVFCPIVVVGFMWAGITFNRHYRIAGLVGGELGILVGLFAWAVVWNAVKETCYRSWKRRRAAN